MPSPSANECSPDSVSVAGVRLRLMGRFASMAISAVVAAVERRGAVVSEEDPELVVLGELASEPQREEAERVARDAGAEEIDESELWRRLGLVQGEERGSLYSPTMLAELVGAPVTMVRRWERRGHLIAASRLNRLSFFDFNEARVARRLAELLAAGLSPDRIDRVVDRLAEAYPSIGRPLAELPLAIEDAVLVVREGDTLTETSGQRRFDFAAAEQAPEQEEAPAVLPINAQMASDAPADDGRSQAIARLDRGDLRGAIEAWRAAVLMSESTAEDHFTLAEWLYEAGDLNGARERYYVALEMDEDYLEARINLGCVLVELGNPELAVEAFRGALATREDFADATFHLARTLDVLDLSDEAAAQWSRFLQIAPEGPWAEEARLRLGEERV